ncbi:MAG: hypothetical protein M3Z13_06930 [Candidatus Dormibacteraeota bacterium]|nr:hypothetical protein [Candidatus Dormibacteraeota bacterium]
MARVIHHRLHGLPPVHLDRVLMQVQALAEARQWRSEPVWMASGHSTSLFHSEYFRHLCEAHGSDVAAGGFLKMQGDETDALVLLFFLRDLSAEYGIRAVWTDEENALLKLRFMEFRRGLLPTGQTLEDHFAKRPVIKKVQDQSIHFYPPGFRVHMSASASDCWGYSLQGLRAFAPSLLEAEQEALKILRGLRHLG